MRGLSSNIGMAPAPAPAVHTAAATTAVLDRSAGGAGDNPLGV